MMVGCGLMEFEEDYFGEEILDILTIEWVEEIIDRLISKGILIDMEEDCGLSRDALDKILDYAEKMEELGKDILSRLIVGIDHLLFETIPEYEYLDEKSRIEYIIVILDLGKVVDMFPIVKEEFESLFPKFHSKYDIINSLS